MCVFKVLLFYFLKASYVLDRLQPKIEGDILPFFISCLSFAEISELQIIMHQLVGAGKMLFNVRKFLLNSSSKKGIG